MPGIFSFSNESVSAFGNPHALAMEDNGFSPGVSGETNAYTPRARMTDAVIAASNLLNKVKTDSSVMGDDLDMAEVKKTDELVSCMAAAALAKPEAFGKARLVRLALFVDEYTKFRRAVAAKQFLDGVVKQRSHEFRERACAWSSEIINAAQPPTIAGKIPWKKVVIVGGLAIALGLGVNYYMTWKRAGEIS